MNSNQLTNLMLQTDLTRFGLNPHEWSIHQIQHHSYLLQHKSDKHFTLQGRTQKQKDKTKWKFLQIFSI